MSGSHYDVAIVGAGPAGCASALAHARRGLRVLLLEADPRSSDRLAGEWLHPPALAILDSLGVDLTPATPYATGKGYVVFPEDGSEPIALPYAAGHFGMAVEHAVLVETLRAHCEHHEHIELVPWARATRIEGQSLTYERRIGTSSHTTSRTVSAPSIIGASGRVASGPLATSPGPLAHGVAASSRIAGIAVEHHALPFEGFLHIFLGGPGPVMAYRIDAHRVRVLCEVPHSLAIPREGGVALFEAYSAVLPNGLREAFGRALAESAPSWASVDLRPRGDLGREGLALIGDAAGTHPPLPAIGLTLALEDAVAIAKSPSFAAYRRERTRRTRVREMLAVGLYEVFADDAEESIAMRRAIYELWREKPRERLRSMGFLSGEDRSHVGFGRAFLRTMLRSSRDFVKDAIATGNVRHTGRVASDLGQRMAWLFGGTLHLTNALPARTKQGLGAPRTAEERYGAALRASTAKAEVVGLPRSGNEDFSARDSLRRGARALIAEQADDGSFEGEVVWCPMLAAQYVMGWHAMGRPLSAERRASVLKHFERTRLADGTWGLHEKSEPYLFVTLLVFVACRLLGLAKDDPLIARAHEFIRREGGAVAVPSWGKLWLAVLNLYSWEGVSAVLPEAWRAPRWLPFHPSRFYCHTRLIYLGMAVLYGEKWSAPVTPRILAIRDEIFPGGWESVDWAKARETLRTAEIHTPWTPALHVGYRVLGAVDRLQSREKRATVLAELREHIRYELRSTNHTCISPVSGLLDQVALFIEDPNDPDLRIAAERFEGWVWEDELDGARVTGARSASWDTAFAAQAMAAAAPHCGNDVRDALRRADTFLVTQQIPRGTGRERHHDRIDPTGGYCFAGVWHGWPVSDCTAEAMLARLESPEGSPTREAMEAAARFVLRCQNTDGGFGSYEARRTDVSLEWINPAEMFGDSMTEKSYVECTASCVTALAAFVHRWPQSELAHECETAIARAVASLTRTQRPDGSWPGMWGVHFVYGTMFGVRGLLAGGVPPHDPRIRRACRFLEERQRADGAWGEHRSSVIVGRYVDHDEGQAVQTAWAMTALLEARHPDFAPIERAARWLASKQSDDGAWPKQEAEGIFFHTALLDYVLYRRYFPVWALGLYESRRAERAKFREHGGESASRPSRLHV
ncbi:FAD-dependent oxidoreductase [Sandaracinus amylolyticus]|uniref:Squalene--hopene cyclase n=1 Tax=Sandaracinus amylolyticus TaxID=927083 RepID=A0A0F6W750_9BACT|nr:FAD-dependent oxidoreductase [Sandaracinus amylolyticus]AKF09142.1 Squalene--hopene cyclase [Sandaracinus amylolyticus]